MTLEFEKLTLEVEKMARSTQRHQRERHFLLEAFLEKLNIHATDWDRLEHCLNLSIQRADMKWFRAARPLDTIEPLNAAFDPPTSPSKATIVAVDGSQILPDRHAPFLYSLINVGVITYFHGSGETPRQFATAELDYPGKGSPDPSSNSSGRFADSRAIVSLRRDAAEIETLARMAWDHKTEARPLLALLDQRLLYWPVVGVGDGDGTKEKVLIAWQEAMTTIRQSDGLLAGYIVRPMKGSIITMLKTLDIEEPDFDLDSLALRDDYFGLTDAILFSQILGPGQRSKVFVDVSQHNDAFRERDVHNEVCFFYLNPGRSGRRIARVDLPIWAAQEAAVVNSIHSLIYDQCQILGDYPYVLARADEIAVVGRRDQENLDVMIENAMQRQSISALPTAKRSSKDVARAGKTRHQI